MDGRYRTKNLKRFIQGLVFKGILKGQESKSWDFFERAPEDLEGLRSQKIFIFQNAQKHV